MSFLPAQTHRAIVFWLSGASLDALRELPVIAALIKDGALAELDPLPITGPQAQYYQTLSGKSPATFGFFDTLMPHNYAVTEELRARGEMPKLLPDILRSVGWDVRYEETDQSELERSIERWEQTASAQPSCLVLKCDGEDALLHDMFARALSRARDWLGESGLLAVFSDRQPARVRRFVNLNNFLAEMGIIEQDQQSHAINWPGTLAYFAGHGQLWLNLLGRDAHGAVHPQDEAEEVCETLIKALPAKLLDPQTGEAVIDHVFRREELYTGDYLFYAPELVVQYAPGYAPSSQSQVIDFDEATFTMPASGELVSSGAHPSTVRGFLLASSPALATAGTVVARAPLTAVAPTLLHALGVEYAGLESPIASLFAPAYLEQHPIQSGAGDQGLSDQDEELIINRLRDLGYV